MNIERRIFLKSSAALLGSGMLLGTDAIPDQVTKEVLHIPGRYTRVCITPLGIPSNGPTPRPRKTGGVHRLRVALKRVYPVSFPFAP